MSKKLYVGNGNIARNVKSMYVGVNGVARKVKKGYIGVGGIARQFYSSGIDFSKAAYQLFGFNNRTEFDAMIINSRYLLLGRSVYSDGISAVAAVATSSDGVSWSLNASAMPESNIWTNSAYQNGLIARVTTKVSSVTPPYVYVSSDGINWTNRGCPSGSGATANRGKIDCIFAGNGRFVMLGAGYMGGKYSTLMFNTSDCITYTGIKYSDTGLSGYNGNPTSNMFCYSPYYQTFFSYNRNYDSNLVIFRSSNGLNWSVTQTSININSYGNLKLVSCDNQALVLYTPCSSYTDYKLSPALISFDGGYNWQEIQLPSAITDIKFLMGMYVAVGHAYIYPAWYVIFMWSEDGINWSSYRTSIHLMSTNLVSDGQKIIIGTAANNVYNNNTGAIVVTP